MVCSTTGIFADRSYRVATTMMRGRTKRLFPLSCQDVVTGSRVPPRQAFGEDLAERSPTIPFDQAQPPRLQPAVIRRTSGRLEHGIDRLLGGGRRAELRGGTAAEKKLHGYHRALTPLRTLRGLL